ncbi:L,D-transpeptidase [bacterium]|nr:L,D-transpeptidase [bacterium]
MGIKTIKNRRRIKLICLIISFFIVGCLNDESDKNDKILSDNTMGKEDVSDWDRISQKLKEKFGLKSNQFVIIVSISRQKLCLIKNGEIIKTYPVSTSKYGIGSKPGSNKTPLGTHYICEKRGEGAKIGTIFKARKNTKKIAKIYTDRTDVPDDFVTTRIMWLKGLEAGVNLETLKRYVYIHGTPEEGLIGTPASHGCVRMKNKEVIELFKLVSVGTFVEIQK